MDLQLESASLSASPAVARSTGQRVYRASLTPIVAGVGIIGFIFIIGSIFGRPTDGKVDAIIAACFVAVLSFVGLLSYRGARLIVASEGITYQTLGYTLIVSWEGILGPATALYGGGTMEVLALRQDAITIQRSRHFGLGMPPLGKSITLAHGHPGQESLRASGGAGYVIPVGLLSAWKNGELRREIQRCAPQLLA